MFLSNIRLFPLLVASLLSAGCAGIMTHPFPDSGDRLSMNTVPDKPSYLHDWPPGAYQIPDTNVFLSNVQGYDSTILPQILFGLVGMEVAGGTIAGDTKSKIRGVEDNLKLDLQTIARQCVQRELSRFKDIGRAYFDKKADEPGIRIVPYLVFDYTQDEKWKLWSVLKIETGEDNFRQTNWKCRYIVGLGDSRPMTGEGGWTSEQGKYLQQAVNGGLEMAAWVMLRDVYGKLRNDKIPTTQMRGRWVFYKDPREVDVQVLETTEKWDLVLPLVEDDEPMAGINVVPKNFDEPAPTPTPTPAPNESTEHTH